MTNYCYQCDVGMSGKFECSFGLHYTCPCSYHADRLVQKKQLRWKSGQTTFEDEIKEVANATTCN